MDLSAKTTSAQERPMYTSTIVIGIASSNGIIGTYVYDAWGNLIATNTAGSSKNNTFSLGWYMIPTNP